MCRIDDKIVHNSILFSLLFLFRPFASVCLKKKKKNKEIAFIKKI